MLDPSQDQVAERLAKLDALRSLGVEPYPHGFDPDSTVTSVVAAHGRATAEELEETAPRARVAGRILASRSHGKAGFLDLSDGGARIQVYGRKSDLSDADFAVWNLLDVGDWLGVQGQVMRTRSGELTVKAESIRLLSKALRPFPIGKVERTEAGEVVHQSLADKELRYRWRHVDLAIHADVRRIFETRSRVISRTRAFLDERGFLEVETPTLQVLHGGAAARPFETRLNALSGLPLYLRIAEELHLKRLIVGGFERVYEIGKVFRNEGIDRTHNPEFTMLEVYQSYADYHDMAELVETLVFTLAEELLGTPRVEHGGRTIDLSPPWKRVTMLAALRDVGGIRQDLSELDRDTLLEACSEHGLRPDPAASEAGLLDLLFSELVQPELVDPVFVLDYPLAISPLAKVHRSNSILTERFEPFVAGWELGNAFTELNDPLDQRRRFEAQARLRDAGDEEAHPIDEDFLTALEHGMPPTGGLGIGIDRLVMLLTGRTSIRDVVLFPFMRPLDPGPGPRDTAAGDGSDPAPSAETETPP